MKDAIVFDLDGTLWDTVSAVVRSWNEVLDRRPEARAHLTEEAMRAYMGKTTEPVSYTHISSSSSSTCSRCSLWRTRR